jgi:hypothetical protein
MAGNVSGFGTFSCNVSGVNVALNQTGTTFTGNVVGDWVITCLAGGQSASQTFTGGVLSNGAINGNAISFSLATADAQNNGTVNGNSMSGNSTWQLNLGSPYGVVVLNGSWGAIRQ